MSLFSDKERVATALVLLFGIFVIGYIDNFFLMWLLFGVIYILAFKEALRLFDLGKGSLTLMATGLWLLAGLYPLADDLLILSGVVFASAIAYNKKLEWRSFLPFLYPTAGIFFIFTMYQEYGVHSLLWLLVVVALTDIGAYGVGKSMGKTPFCETSPKKTIEGVAGGVIIATFGGMFLGTIYVDLFVAMVVSFGVALASVFGDLFESYLKRRAGVKDSGTLLPGHGGILDRIDGYLFGGIVMLVLLRGLV